jgi:hypothetical protein
MILIGIAKVKGWVPEAGALQDSPLPPNAPNQKRVMIYALRLPSAPVFCIWLLGDSEEKKILSLSVTISSAVSRHRKLAQFSMSLDKCL